MTLPPRWERFVGEHCPLRLVEAREELSRVLAEHDAERAGPLQLARDYMSQSLEPLPAEQPAPTVPDDHSTCLHSWNRCKCVVESAAPAQAAPDGGRLSDWPTTRFAWCCWCMRRDIPSAAARDHWSTCGEHPANAQIAALEAKLAAAERERDEALARATDAERDADIAEAAASKATGDERARCLAHFRRRHGTALISFLEEDIASGRPAP